MKKAIVYVDCCRECPFADRIRSGINIYEQDKVYCSHLGKVVELLEIDKDCPLEDE